MVDLKLVNNVKPVFKCDDFFKEKFKQSQCLLTISVGQEVHEGEKFSASIDLVNRHFSSCIMLVDDSLQRHSMALDTDDEPESFYDKSIKEGDLWLDRNEKHYKKLTILKDIIRWDRWLQHSHYRVCRDNIKNFISSNLFYKKAFEDTANEFLRRYSFRLGMNTVFNMNRAYNLCIDYLIEECTALCLWPELNCHFEVYPSKRNMAMAETHKHFVLPNFPDLLYAVSIKFKNRKQLQPQQFSVLEKI